MEGSTDAKSDVYHHPHVEVAYKPDEEFNVEKYGTQRDMHDMARMGKVQLLRVRLCRLNLKRLLKCFQSATSVIIRSSDFP